MANYYDVLFKLCGFEDDELSKERSRIERALGKLEIGMEDIQPAVAWIRQNHDVDMAGVRKSLGLWLKELIDLVLAKEEGKKVVYYGFPTITGPALAIAAASEDILCTCPDVVLCYALGQVFNKLTPILEAGEENGLPPGHALCSLQQIRVGGLAKGIIPVPDMVLTSSYYCDMGSKTDELLHYRYGHPAVYIDGSMDSGWGEFPEYLPDRVEYLGAQLEKAFDKVGDILGLEIDEEARTEAASRNREMFGALSELVGLLEKADPQPISIVEAEIARRVTNGSASRRILMEGREAVDILNREVRKRINKGIGIVEKGAPRVMIVCAHFSDPRILHMIEGTGLSVSATVYGSLYTESAKLQKATPYISGETLAKREMECGLYHGTYGLLRRIAEIAEEANVDGFIWQYLFNCRPSAQCSHLLKQLVEKETGIPVLSLEMDYYDSRNYSTEALRTKVETFAEMLRARKPFAGI